MNLEVLPQNSPEGLVNLISEFLNVDYDKRPKLNKYVLEKFGEQF